MLAHTFAQVKLLRWVRLLYINLTFKPHSSVGWFLGLNDIAWRQVSDLYPSKCSQVFMGPQPLKNITGGT
jgi:hypothetical protein